METLAKLIVSRDNTNNNSRFNIKITRLTLVNESYNIRVYTKIN